MRYLFMCLLLISLSACKVSHYVTLDTGEKVDCNKAPTVWWGEKGQQPTSKEVKSLCACFDWTIESRE